VDALATSLAGATAVQVLAGPRLRGDRWEHRLGDVLAALGSPRVPTFVETRASDVLDMPLPVQRQVGSDGERPRYDARLDHADRVLAQLVRAELVALLPPLVEQLKPYAAKRGRRNDDDVNSWREYECGHALADFVESYRRCTVDGQPCDVAPRVFLVGGVRIAAREPDVFVPEGCNEVLGTDVIARVRALSRDAVEAAIVDFDPRWLELADRLGAITEVSDAMTDICAPRRRRFTATDLADAHDRLARIGNDLASNEPPRTPRWLFDPGTFRVPGIGPVRQLARYDAGANSPSQRIVGEARALRQFVLSRAMCRAASDAKPLVVMVLRAGEPAPEYFGYLYEEELVCADLPPLR
jgi:hypothetical protein